MRILLIEDDHSLAAVIRDGLEEAGFAVDLAHNGVDGLWSATEAPNGRYDLIICDLLLPRLSGYEVCRRLRAARVWTPILILTAKDGEYDQADALDLGADDYLTKPFSFVVLLARIRALVRRGSPVRPVVLAAGDLTVDPARRRVARAGQEIGVTPREFTLLELLARHAGDVVSKTAIVENVWDANFTGDANIVEVYIRYLRKKIDYPFGRAAIQTVRGTGYRLAADGG